MQTRPRWMNAMLTEAEGCKTRMPWERGLRRQAFIARRAVAASARTPVVMARTQPDQTENDDVEALLMALA